jgi:hypothetical protein
MKKPHRFFYTKELPATEELNLSREKPVSDKELNQLLKKSAAAGTAKKSKTKKAA